MTARSVVPLVVSSLLTCCFGLPVQEDSVQCGNHMRVDPGAAGWRADLSVRAQEDYSGVWIEMSFDQKLDSFSSTYGNVTRLNGTSFSILNVNGRVLQEIPFDITFHTTCDPCTEPPLLKSLIINGKTLCLNTEIHEIQPTIINSKTNEIKDDNKVNKSTLTGTTDDAKAIDNETKNNTIVSDKTTLKNKTTNTILPEIINKTNEHKTDDKDTPDFEYSSQSDTLNDTSQSYTSNDTSVNGEALNDNKTVIETVNKEFKTIINTSKLNTDRINVQNATAKDDGANKVASEKPGINKSKIELRKLDESIMEKLLETKVDTDVLRELADVESYYSVRNLEKALFKHHVYEKMSTSPDYVKMMN